MHLIFTTPILADVLTQPWGGVFLLILSFMAVIRKS